MGEMKTAEAARRRFSDDTTIGSGHGWARRLGLSCLLMALACPGAAQSVYRDPQQRFTLRVPPGWTPAGGESGANLVRGRAYASLAVMDSRSTAPELVSEVAGRVGQQWKAMNEVKRGTGLVGGREGAFAFFSGSNPAGAQAFLKISAVVVSGKGYVLFLSAPQAEFGGLKSDFDAIEAGFLPAGTGVPGAASEKAAALEAAFKAGILTREEYESKKRELAGSAAAAPATSEAPGPGAGAEFRAPDGSFVTRAPLGWKVRTVQGGAQPLHIFEPEGGGDERILVMASPAPSNSMDDLIQQAAALVMQMFPGLRPAGPPSRGQSGGAASAEVSYRGILANGTQASAWHGLLVKDGFAFGVLGLAMTGTAQRTEEAARVLYRNMRPGNVPENTQLARAIVGRWTFVQGSQHGGGSQRTSTYVSRQVTFFADGRFHYVGGVAVGTERGGASVDSQNTGTYRVYGNTLYAQIQGGGQAVYTLELVPGGGLRINGELYIRE